VVDGVAAVQQMRGAYRGQLFVEQVLAFALGPRLRAVDHGGIESLATKVHPVLHAAGQFHRHVGAQFLPVQQLGQQPAQHAGRGLDLQRGTANAGVLDCLADHVEHLPDPRIQRLALFGQTQAASLAMEQRIPQMLLKPGDLPAHCALGDMQLLGGPGEVAALCGDQKRVQGGQGRQSFHVDPSHDVRTWLV